MAITAPWQLNAVKKAFIKDKRKEEIEKSKRTYSDTTQFGRSQQQILAPPTQQFYSITRKETKN